MPRTTVYIRNDDYEKWKNIENKSELISEAINRSLSYSSPEDNYHERHVIQPEVPPVHKDLTSHEPTANDTKAIIRENERMISILSESQDPEDLEKAKELYDTNIMMREYLERNYGEKR